MYMMEKLDAYKQEIERHRAVSEWNENRAWVRKNSKDEDELLIRYACEMLRIHEDVKRYCNALLMQAQDRQQEVPYLQAELRHCTKKYDELNKKYKALKKKAAPAKKPAAKTADKKGT